MTIHDRRWFLQAGVASAALVGLGACGKDSSSSTPARPSWGGELIDPPFAKPDVTLTTMTGESFPFREATQGRLTFLYFGYTNCPDQCPIWLSTISRARKLVRSGPGRTPLVLFVGVDVKRDTPQQLRTYLGNIDASFVGLTGSEHVIAQANDAMKFPPIEIGPMGKDGTQMVGHYAKAAAFSPDDQCHRLYGFDVRPAKLAADLPRLARSQYR